MTKSEIEKTLKNFIIETFLFGQDPGISSSDSLLEKGIIDSTSVLELVAFIEKKFHISVDDTEIVPDNLDSIDSITTYVMGKQEKG